MKKKYPSLGVHYRFSFYDPVLCVSEELGQCKNLNLLTTSQLPAVVPNVCELTNFKVQVYSF